MTDEPNPDTEHVLTQALKEALSLGDNTIAPEHLILAICRDSTTTAAKILGSFPQFDYETFRKRLIRHRATQHPLATLFIGVVPPALRPLVTDFTAPLFEKLIPKPRPTHG